MDRSHKDVGEKKCFQHNVDKARMLGRRIIQSSLYMPVDWQRRLQIWRHTSFNWALWLRPCDAIQEHVDLVLSVGPDLVQSA